MRIAKSKYSKPLKKYQPGGLMNFLNSPIGQNMSQQIGGSMMGGAGGAGGMAGMMGKGMGGMTSGGAIGMGIDMLSNFIPQKQKAPIQGEGITTGAAEKYNETIAKNQRTKAAVSGGLSAAGDMAMMMPGIGTAVGIGLKGLGAAAKAIPFGKGKEQEAMHEFNRMSAMQGQMDAQAEGARNAAAITGFQAPAYGKKGMKFKTKYSRKW